MEIFLKTVEILKRYKLVSLEWPIRIQRIIPSVQKRHFTWSHSLVTGVSFPLTRTFSVICECVSMWGVSMFVNNMFFAYFSCCGNLYHWIRETHEIHKHGSPTNIDYSTINDIQSNYKLFLSFIRYSIIELQL